MSDDARAIVAAVLAAASAQTRRPWRELHDEYAAILAELRQPTPEERERREAWAAEVATDTAGGEGETAPKW